MDFIGGVKHRTRTLTLNSRIFVLRKKVTTLRKSFIQSASLDRIKMENPLVDNKFAAMTMDAGQIGGTNLFITNLVASHLKCCFTSTIHDVVISDDHKSLCHLLAAVFKALANDKKTFISVVICDGATYQTKALHWKITLHFERHTVMIPFDLGF
jgi:hypothetical protein